MIYPVNFHPVRLLTMRRIAAAVVSLTLLLVTLPSKSGAHEFEDGFVERSVAVVIRDNIAIVEYSIGLNPDTKVQLIDFWMSQAAPAVAATGEEVGEDIGRETGDAVSPSSPATSADFLRLAGENVCRRLRVLVGDDPVTPRLISSLASSRHHVDVTVTMEFPLPLKGASVPTLIEISDMNFFPSSFRNLPVTENTQAVRKEWEAGNLALDGDQLRPAPFGGGFRYAIKGKGSAMLSRSNVASILIRAKRKLDANFSEAQLDGAYKIQAEVVIVE